MPKKLSMNSMGTVKTFPRNTQRIPKFIPKDCYTQNTLKVYFNKMKVEQNWYNRT